MLLIECPWCGARDESEFENGGPVRDRRPEDAAALTDEQWCDYLMFKPNTAGWLRERWWHVHGCGRWFEVSRNTLTHETGDPDDER